MIALHHPDGTMSVDLGIVRFATRDEITFTDGSKVTIPTLEWERYRLSALRARVDPHDEQEKTR